MDKKIVKSYECENMLNSNQQTSSNVIRCPIPTAPVLENCDDAPYSVTILRDPPPYSPPLLSQSNTEPFLTEISQKENGKSRQLRRCDTDVMFKVALFGGIIAGRVILK
ncbi:hypothetical protein WUBG_14380 [Wuchereria bancrofti]|uniref:Uncharacterized protein n=1 Tax=Wuchereria bancrofti TaxID=6293 RepID=J9ECE7_WUCBA|nr:hypothetical protein WUBG_14380 [Wuchereria bancrofti]